MTTRQEIVKLLQRKGQMRFSKIKYSFDHISPAVVSKEICKATQRGEIIKVERGLYRACKPSDDAPAAPEIKVYRLTTSTEFDGPGIDIDAIHRR